MSQPDRLDDVVQTLGELGKTAVPVEDQLRAGYRRERIVRLIGSAITAEGRRARRRRAFPWLAAAAALVLGIGGAGAWNWYHVVGPSNPVAAATERASAGEARLVAGDVSVRRNGQATALHAGDVLTGGESVSTAAYSVAEIGIASGRAELEASSELELVAPTASERRLRLGSGSVDVDLPRKLEGGKHLIVETPDVEVMVIGTAFTVAVGSEHGAASTHVRVRRGTVWIMHAGTQRAVLHAGDEWTSPVAKAAAVTPEPVSPAPVAGRALHERPRRAAPPARVVERTRVVDSGTLAEENRMFQAGLTARNAGDAGGAADAFASLLAHYPRSVLREQALAEQFRALERAGRGSAAAVGARRYLASYPNGFARADAERIANGLLGGR
ncbi:MAG TPA: FecR domain-containing protein [Polyangiaceae bacterium]|nr:FecR domain-containing protein [Polyangiaceae bacterium]